MDSNIPLRSAGYLEVYHMGSQWEDKSKPHLNIVFVGHVDHGKSTTVAIRQWSYRTTRYR